MSQDSGPARRLVEEWREEISLLKKADRELAAWLGRYQGLDGTKHVKSARAQVRRRLEELKGYD